MPVCSNFPGCTSDFPGTYTTSMGGCFGSSVRCGSQEKNMQENVACVNETMRVQIACIEICCCCGTVGVKTHFVNAYSVNRKLHPHATGHIACTAKSEPNPFEMRLNTTQILVQTRSNILRNPCHLTNLRYQEWDKITKVRNNS